MSHLQVWAQDFVCAHVIMRLYPEGQDPEARLDHNKVFLGNVAHWCQKPDIYRLCWRYNVMPLEVFRPEKQAALRESWKGKPIF